MQTSVSSHCTFFWRNLHTALRSIRTVQRGLHNVTCGVRHEGKGFHLAASKKRNETLAIIYCKTRLHATNRRLDIAEQEPSTYGTPLATAPSSTFLG